MNVINLILLIFNILLMLFIIYIITYVKKRSEINATKKDIELLTEKVESVKLDYLKKIEEYKNELTIKYELEKILVNSKVEAYQIATSLKIAILKRVNNMGNEMELNEQLFQKIPDLLIYLDSQVRLHNDFKVEMSELQSNYHDIVRYIEQIKVAGAKNYSINFDKIIGTIDKIQTKLLE